MKRKEHDSLQSAKSPPKRRKATSRFTENDNVQDADDTDELSLPTEKVSRGKAQRTPQSSRTVHLNGKRNDEEEDELGGGSPTPTLYRTSLFTTPGKKVKSPANSKRTDQSARRKAAKALAEQQAGEEWAETNDLAEEILEDFDDLQEGIDVFTQPEDIARAAIELGENIEAETPSKRGRGRPKGARNKRSPTPEGDLPPEERYFFQNRSGPPQISSNTLKGLKLLTHEEYFEQMRDYRDHHESERAYLIKLHKRSFPQWSFELQEGFSICLYGWGSKRRLVSTFAEWLYNRTSNPPKIVIVNGYIPKLNVRTVLSTLAATMVDNGETPPSYTGQPEEILEAMLTYLNLHPPVSQIVVIINSVDSPSLRRHGTQTLLAKMAAHRSISLLVTTDTPTSALLWNSTLSDQFNFAFHDCTTFTPYETELNVVDEVHELLGRKGQRMGGKEGVEYVLKSLPENARNLYRILLTEVLTVMNEGVDGLPEDDLAGEEVGPTKRHPADNQEEVGIEYRALYQKASEEFICSSDMNFRFLLKEFHDHQLITSRRDVTGTELLGVPLGKEEMEGILEDLVIG